MDMNKAPNIKHANSLQVDLSRCIFRGQGRCGKVYLMPDGRAIKIFRSEEDCIQEFMILESVKGNKHFPMAYECNGNSMIRDYVDGVPLVQYIKRYGLSKKLSQNLIELIRDFKNLGFLRLDMRCSHIFVQADESVMVIDPRNHYTEVVPYPRKMLGTLNKLHVTRNFNDSLKAHYPELYSEWKRLK